MAYLSTEDHSSKLMTAFTADDPQTTVLGGGLARLSLRSMQLACTVS
jgi:hypothetical protein